MHNRFCVDIGYKKRTVSILNLILDSRSETELTGMRFYYALCIINYAFRKIHYTMKSLILAQDER